jgi:DNA-directed RNA polymerase subunit RPC12/RpoP
MFGVVLPPPKLSLMYKCRTCGHKFRPLLLFMPRKCPLCGGKDLKVSVGFIERPPGPIVY